MARTMTLELLYEIPKEQILHIHGDAYKTKKLVFGHNIYKGGYNYPYDGEKVADVLERYVSIQPLFWRFER